MWLGLAAKGLHVAGLVGLAGLARLAGLAGLAGKFKVPRILMLIRLSGGLTPHSSMHN